MFFRIFSTLVLLAVFGGGIWYILRSTPAKDVERLRSKVQKFMGDGEAKALEKLLSAEELEELNSSGKSLDDFATRLDLSRKAADRILTIAPYSEYDIGLRAQIEERAGNCREALKVYDRFKGMKQEPSWIHIRRANIYSRMGLVARARSELLASADERPFQANLMLGKIELRTFQPLKALKYFREAFEVARDPGEDPMERIEAQGQLSIALKGLISRAGAFDAFSYGRAEGAPARQEQVSRQIAFWKEELNSVLDNAISSLHKIKSGSRQAFLRRMFQAADLYELYGDPPHILKGIQLLEPLLREDDAVPADRIGIRLGGLKLRLIPTSDPETGKRLLAEVEKHFQAALESTRAEGGLDALEGEEDGAADLIPHGMPTSQESLLWKNLLLIAEILLESDGSWRLIHDEKFGQKDPLRISSRLTSLVKDEKGYWGQRAMLLKGMALLREGDGEAEKVLFEFTENVSADSRWAALFGIGAMCFRLNPDSLLFLRFLKEAEDGAEREHETLIVPAVRIIRESIGHRMRRIASNDFSGTQDDRIRLEKEAEILERDLRSMIDGGVSRADGADSFLSFSSAAAVVIGPKGAIEVLRRGKEQLGRSDLPDPRKLHALRGRLAQALFDWAISLDSIGGAKGGTVQGESSGEKSLSQNSAVGQRPSEAASGKERRRGDLAEPIVGTGRPPSLTGTAGQERRSITPLQPAESRRDFGIGSKWDAYRESLAEYLFLYKTYPYRNEFLEKAAFIIRRFRTDEGQAAGGLDLGLLMKPLFPGASAEEAGAMGKVLELLSLGKIEEVSKKAEALREVDRLRPFIGLVLGSVFFLDFKNLSGEDSRNEVSRARESLERARAIFREEFQKFPDYLPLRIELSRLELAEVKEGDEVRDDVLKELRLLAAESEGSGFISCAYPIYNLQALAIQRHIESLIHGDRSASKRPKAGQLRSLLLQWRTALRRAIRADPEVPEPYLMLARTYLGAPGSSNRPVSRQAADPWGAFEPDWIKAVSVLKMAPETQTVLSAIAEIYLQKLHRPRMALECYRRLLDREPTISSLRATVGCFLEIASQKPSSAGGAKTDGEFHSAARRFLDEFEVRLSRASGPSQGFREEFPALKSMLLALIAQDEARSATSIDAEKLMAEAIQRYWEALRGYNGLGKNPPAEVSNNLAWLIAQRPESRAEALKIILELRERLLRTQEERNRSAVEDTYGWILFLNGDLEESEKTYRNLLDADPSAVFRFHLARVLFEQKKYQQAKEEIDLALSSMEKFEELGEARKLQGKIEAKLKEALAEN